MMTFINRPMIGVEYCNLWFQVVDQQVSATEPLGYFAVAHGLARTVICKVL